MLYPVHLAAMDGIQTYKFNSDSHLLHRWMYAIVLANGFILYV